MDGPGPTWQPGGWPCSIPVPEDMGSAGLYPQWDEHFLSSASLLPIINIFINCLHLLIRLNYWQHFIDALCLKDSSSCLQAKDHFVVSLVSPSSLLACIKSVAILIASFSRFYS